MRNFATMAKRPVRGRRVRWRRTGGRDAQALAAVEDGVARGALAGDRRASRDRLRGLAGWTFAAILFLLAIQVPTPNGIFSEYGLGLLVGAVVVSLAAAALALPAASRITALAAMLLVGLAVLLVTIIGLTLASLYQPSASSSLWTRDRQPDRAASPPLALADRRLCGDHPQRRSGTTLRDRGAAPRPPGALQTAVLLAFPHYPAFVSQGAHDSPPNSWTYVRGLIGSSSKDDAETRRVDGARVELAQPALMDEAIARLAPQVPGQTDVYAIGIAGWAEQDVFIKELEGALAAFGKILPLQDRVSAPGQSRRHGRADTGCGARELRRRGPRRRARDGPARGRAGVVHDLARLDGRHRAAPAGTGQQRTRARRMSLPCSTARASATASSWCRPVIRACSCKPLANDNTIVLTAADDKSTSFGCSQRAGVDLFRRCILQSASQAGCDAGAGVPQRQGHHRPVGGARRFDAVKSARALRAGAGREARAAWRVAPGPRHAALRSRNHPGMTIRQVAADAGPPGSSICAYPHSGNRYPLFRDMR